MTCIRNNLLLLKLSHTSHVDGPASAPPAPERLRVSITAESESQGNLKAGAWVSPQWGGCSYEGNIDFRVLGGGGGGLLSIFIGSGGVNSDENPGLSISCGCFFGGMGGGVPGMSKALPSLSLSSDE